MQKAGWGFWALEAVDPPDWDLAFDVGPCPDVDEDSADYAARCEEHDDAGWGQEQ